MGMSLREFNILLDKSSKKSKYNSKKEIIDGIKFDSQKEATRYSELKLLEKNGTVLELKLQPEFLLQEGFKDNTGKRHREIKYRADFQVKYKCGKTVVIDTKGYRTNEYKLKLKLFLKRYPDVEFREE